MDSVESMGADVGGTLSSLYMESLGSDGWSIAFQVVVFLYSFLGLGIVCDDYLVPSLEVLCIRWNVREDVAGASFMAFGSAAPEIIVNAISTLKASNASPDSINLGLGAILGSSVIAFSLIPGCCALLSGSLVTSLELKRRPLLRDISTYTIALALLVSAFYDGEIVLPECLALLGLYVLYGIVVFFSPSARHWYRHSYLSHPVAHQESFVVLHEAARQERRKSRRAERRRERELGRHASSTESATSVSSSTTSSSSTTFALGVGVGGSEEADVRMPLPRFQEEEEDEEEEEEEEGEGTESQEEDEIADMERVQATNTALGSIDDMDEMVSEFNQGAYGNSSNTTNNNSNSSSSSSSSANASNGSGLTSALLGDGARGESYDTMAAQAQRSPGLSVSSSVGSGAALGRGASLLGKTYRVVAWPLETLFWLCVPASARGSSAEWRYPLTFLASFAWVAFFSFVISAVVERWGELTHVPLSFFGFFLVSLGAEVPDTVQSVTVARRGYGSMAVSNAIGSQICNICFGLGMPYTIALLSGSRIIVSDADHLLFAAYLQLCNILVLVALLFVPVCVHGQQKARITRSKAAVMIAMYCLVLVAYGARAFGSGPTAASVAPPPV